MKHVQKSLNKFEARTQEVMESYKALKEKRERLQAELGEMKRTVSIDLSAGDLLAGNYQKKNSKVADLQEEISAIDEFINNVENLRLQHRTSDLAIVCKADKELESIGEDLLKDYLKQTEELKKQSQDLDKRTSKFIAQIEDICNEYNELTAQQQELNKIQEMIERRTNLKANKVALQYKNVFALNKFREVNNFVKTH